MQLAVQQQICTWNKSTLMWMMYGKEQMMFMNMYVLDYTFHWFSVWQFSHFEFHKRQNFLTRWVTISFLRRTLLHGVNYLVLMKKVRIKQSCRTRKKFTKCFTGHKHIYLYIRRISLAVFPWQCNWGEKSIWMIKLASLKS